MDMTSVLPGTAGGGTPQPVLPPGYAAVGVGRALVWVAAGGDVEAASIPTGGTVASAVDPVPQPATRQTTTSKSEKTLIIGSPFDLCQFA
jgi:hypothetical protein